MKSEKEFDDIFRQRFNENNSPADQENWLVAKEKIDCHFKKKKRRVIIFWMISIGVFFLSGILFLNHTEINQLANSTSTDVNIYDRKIFNSNRPQWNIFQKNDIKITEVKEEQKKQTQLSGINKITPKTINNSRIPKTNKKAKNSNLIIIGIPFVKQQSDNLNVVENSVEANDSKAATKEINNTTENYSNSSKLSETNILSNIDTFVFKLPFDSVIKKTDGIILSEEKPTDIFIGLVAAGIISKWNNANIALNFMVGISFEYNINKKFKAELDALYFEKSKVSRSKDFSSYYITQTENTSTEYGSRSTNISIETKALQYFSVPIILKYKISKKQFVEAGAAFNYLINTRSNYVTTMKTNDILESEVSQIEKGYNNGFNQIDFSVLAGYGYCLNKNILAFARLNFGLTDVTKNDYYTHAYKDNTTHISIGLKTQILTFK